jgi:predicted metal-dependent hydrolase
MQVEVTRSERRKKTVQARVLDGVLKIAIPAHMTAEEEAHWVEVMHRRLALQRDTDGIDLEESATRLARDHDLPVPAKIEWSNRQNTRWGSTTRGTRHIRISSRLATYPRWVVDYVVVHELAHLVEPNHGPEFWSLVDRYDRAERARGYLIAKADGLL